MSHGWPRRRTWPESITSMLMLQIAGDEQRIACVTMWTITYTMSNDIDGLNDHLVFLFVSWEVQLSK